MLEVEQVQPAALREALAYVLAEPGHAGLAGSRQIGGYVEYLSACSVAWEGFRCRRGERVTGLVFVLLPPGAAAIVMLPTPGEHGIRAADQAQLLGDTLRRLRPRALYYAQALVEPDAPRKRAVLLEAGFRRLTTLIYLERDVASAGRAQAARQDVEWVPFSRDTAAEFAATLEATYADSLDCPELAGLRPIEDVIASHRAAGVTGSQAWELARKSGTNAACLLLATLAEGALLEIVYMGVVPRFRRAGVGALLLERAVQRARALGAVRMMVVVDRRNAPARRLYERSGFVPVTTREAFLHTWCERERAP